MINIVNSTVDFKRISYKGGNSIIPKKYHYFDEDGNEIFPKPGEKYIFMGEEKIYPF